MAHRSGQDLAPRLEQRRGRSLGPRWAKPWTMSSPVRHCSDLRLGTEHRWWSTRWLVPAWSPAARSSAAGVTVRPLGRSTVPRTARASGRAHTRAGTCRRESVMPSDRKPRSAPSNTDGHDAADVARHVQGGLELRTTRETAPNNVEVAAHHRGLHDAAKFGPAEGAVGARAQRSQWGRGLKTGIGHKIRIASTNQNPIRMHACMGSGAHHAARVGRHGPRTTRKVVPKKCRGLPYAGRLHGRARADLRAVTECDAPTGVDLPVRGRSVRGHRWLRTIRSGPWQAPLHTIVHPISMPVCEHACGEMGTKRTMAAEAAAGHRGRDCPDHDQATKCLVCQHVAHRTGDAGVDRRTRAHTIENLKKAPIPTHKNAARRPQFRHTERRQKRDDQHEIPGGATLITMTVAALVDKNIRTGQIDSDVEAIVQTHRSAPAAPGRASMSSAGAPSPWWPAGSVAESPCRSGPAGGAASRQHRFQPRGRLLDLEHACMPVRDQVCDQLGLGLAPDPAIRGSRPRAPAQHGRHRPRPASGAVSRRPLASRVPPAE